REELGLPVPRQPLRPARPHPQRPGHRAAGDPLAARRRRGETGGPVRPGRGPPGLRLGTLRGFRTSRDELRPPKPAYARRDRHAGGYFFSGFSALALSALPSPFTSTVVAVILYSMVTLAPVLSSPVILVSLSRAISHFSLPFWTVIVVSLTSRTGPVTW